MQCRSFKMNKGIELDEDLENAQEITYRSVKNGVDNAKQRVRFRS